jgi:hypothetical protein
LKEILTQSQRSRLANRRKSDERNASIAVLDDIETFSRALACTRCWFQQLCAQFGQLSFQQTQMALENDNIYARVSLSNMQKNTNGADAE